MFGLNKQLISTDEEKINNLLTRGVEEIIDKTNLEKKLKIGKQLRVKLGIDPTSSSIHIGRSIPLLKLKDFQELGHKVVFIIGDFTGIIGDTSDKESERPMLKEEEVKANMKNYVSQAGKILDISKCEIKYNSSWLGKINYTELGSQADQFSLSDFISRENIKKRLDLGKRVSLRELLYPLMQGYDSVAVKADVELGGTDQKFNLLSGRELQRFYNQDPQDILMNPLIEGLDGRKMSSSWGNTINLLDDANNMYGKVMSLSDDLIVKYFKLVTRVPLQNIDEYQKMLDTGTNPKEVKSKLAFEITRMYHGEELAKAAENNFDNTFSKGGIPEEIKTIEVKNGTVLSEVLISNEIVSSKNELRRLIDDGAVTNIDLSKKVEDVDEKAENGVYKVGKRRFIKIKVN